MNFTYIVVWMLKKGDKIHRKSFSQKAAARGYAMGLQECNPKVQVAIFKF